MWGRALECSGVSVKRVEFVGHFGGCRLVAEFLPELAGESPDVAGAVGLVGVVAESRVGFASRSPSARRSSGASVAGWSADGR